jgi:putative flippase GtrA
LLIGATGLALDVLGFSFGLNVLGLMPTAAAACAFVVALALVSLANRRWAFRMRGIEEGRENGGLIAEAVSAAGALSAVPGRFELVAAGDAAVALPLRPARPLAGEAERAAGHLAFAAVVWELLLAAIDYNKRRLGLFAAVGGFCLFVQLGILDALETDGAKPYQADAVAFFVSAQLNFFLSYRLTWGDTARATGRGLVWKWLMFLGVACGSTLINVAVFAALQPALGALPAVLVAGAVSMVGTYLMNDQLVFSPDTLSRTQVKARPPVDSIAWFLPAHNEAENLEPLTRSALDYLGSLGLPATLIIVDDGSTDATATVCEQLAAEDTRISIARHEINRGYGAALRTGLQTGLETGRNVIGFCDADRQFEIESLGPMLEAIAEADLVLGYRVKRADSWDRRLKGQFWQSLNRLVLPVRARDFDCGMKLFRREVVEQLLPILRGEYATISPEIIFRAQQAGFHAVEVPVQHRSRQAGEQSGSDEKVVLGSLVSLAQLIREEN